MLVFGRVHETGVFLVNQIFTLRKNGEGFGGHDGETAECHTGGNI